MDSRGRLVVTGAGGFIGTRLVQVALAEGWEVTALLRDTTRLSHLECPKLRSVRWAVGDDISNLGLLPGVDAVCHLASFIPPDYADPVHAEQCLRVNALGTLELAQQASEARVGRFVLFPAYRATYYLTSKLAAELFLHQQSIRKALPIAILRLASVYGDGMSGKGMIAEFRRRISDGREVEIHNGGRHSVDLVHVNDVAAASLRVVENQVDGLLNIGSGESRTSLEVANILVSIMKGNQKCIKVHGDDLLTPSTGFPALNIEKAKRAFDFDPLGLEDGLRLWLQA
jgi:UDP-glucose 4-epimerase